MITARSDRSWWGWGTTDRALSDAESAELGALLPGLPEKPRPVPLLADIELPAPRVQPPPTLSATISTAPEDRAAHTYGKADRARVHVVPHSYLLVRPA